MSLNVWKTGENGANVETKSKMQGRSKNSVEFLELGRVSLIEKFAQKLDRVSENSVEFLKSRSSFFYRKIWKQGTAW